MNGSAFQMPLAIFNAEYLWTSEDSAFYNIESRPQNYEDFIKLYYGLLEGKIRPEEIFARGGILEVICKKLYGEGVGEIMARLYALQGKHGEPPIAVASNVSIYTNYSKVVYPMRWDNEMDECEIAEKLERFSECKRMSEAALELCGAALERNDLAPPLRLDIEVMRECFGMGAKLTDCLYEYMKVYRVLDEGFRSGKIDTSDILCKIEHVKSKSEQFTAYVNATKKPVLDKFGGIYIRRAEMADFLEYNIALMSESINEGKRIPDKRKPLPTREWL